MYHPKQISKVDRQILRTLIQEYGVGSIAKTMSDLLCETKKNCTDGNLRDWHIQQLLEFSNNSNEKSQREII